MLEEVAGLAACSNGLILNSLGWVGVRTKVAPLSYRSVNSIWPEASWWLLDKEHSSNRQELICMAGHLAQLVRAA